MVLYIFRGPYGPIWGGGAPRATGPTQAFGLGRELVGCVGGDALRVSRKRDDPLRASWHTLVYPPRRSYGTPADNVRDMGVATGAHIQGVGRSLERGWTSSMAELAAKPHFLLH